MNKKIFLTIVIIVFIGAAISPPILKNLEEKGILKDISVGNTYTEPEYSDNPLYFLKNGIGFLRYKVNDTYGNYMPAAQKNVMYYNVAMKKINAATESWQVAGASQTDLDKLNGDKKPSKTPSNSPSPEPSAMTTPSNSPSPEPTHLPGTTPTNTPVPTATFTPTPSPTPERLITGIDYKFIKKDKVRNYYNIHVTDSYGNEYNILDMGYLASLSTKKKNAATQAGYINKLYEANKDVNFYLYVGTSLQDYEMFSTIIPEEGNSAEALEVFRSKLNPGIVMREYGFDSILDRLDWNYYTDHHWGPEGQDKGYRDIIEMMREQTPEILEARKVVAKHLIEGAKFYGSYARNCALIDSWEEFLVYEYDLPEHTNVYYTSSRTGTFMDRLAKLQKKPPTSINTNLYAEMYVTSSSFTYPDNHTGRNLLVIGDSYSQSITEQIAASFDNTYVYFYWNCEKLNYNEFIKEHNITDVLVLEFSERIVYNLLGDCKINKINLD